MSKYTTELRFLVEGGFDLGLHDYPLYEFENVNQGIDYRTFLNNKIIEHFYFREIGIETPALFKRMLNRKLNEIMPYYNQRYKSIDIIFNPLNNVDLTETFTHSVTDTGTANSTGTNTLHNTKETNGTNEETVDNVNVLSDTPQSSLSNDDIKNNTYATQTVHNVNETNSTLGDNMTEDGTQSSTNNLTNNNTRSETYSKHESGSSAGYLFTQNIEHWRNMMINIDMEIIEELEPLFMQLW